MMVVVCSLCVPIEQRSGANAVFIVRLFADRPRIMDSPVSVTVNESENATFTCTAAADSGDLIVEWICSDGSNCGSSSKEERSDGYVTSILEIPGETNLNVTCVVNQNLTSLLSEESNVEVQPPPTESLQRTAKLIVIPAPTTTTTQSENPPSSQDPGVSPSNGELK